MTLQDLKDNREQIIEKIIASENGDNSRLSEIMSTMKEFVEFGCGYDNWEQLLDYLLNYTFRKTSRKVSKTATIICGMIDKGYLPEYDIKKHLH